MIFYWRIECNTIEPIKKLETNYHIVVEMKALTGMREIGSFLISTDREFAFDTFNSLKGKTGFTETQILRLTLLETQGDAKLTIERIGCNLDELADNCKVIIRDAFKFFNLEK